MRKLLLILLLYISLLCVGCQPSSDQYTFAQEIEYNDYVGILVIGEQLSIFTDIEYNYEKIDYYFSEITNLKGELNNQDKIRLVYSSAKKSVSTYCVFENNSLFNDCYNTKTENYVIATNFYIVIGFYDPNNNDVLGIRFVELLDGYDASISISEQTQSIQDIVSRYTTVIDSLESTSTETTDSTNTNTDT